MIVPTDLIDPAGSIDLGMFPGSDQAAVEAILAAYIARAEAILDARGVTDEDVRDAATEVYVYYLSADTVCRRVTLQAASLTFAEDGSRTRTQGQIDSWCERAAKYLAEFNALAPEPPTAGTTDNRASTTSVPTTFSW